MNINRRKRRTNEDNSALSDLAFLLIIYFIVIAGFNVNKGFLMNLPAKDSSRLILKDDLMRFELNESGMILYNGIVMNYQTAENEIKYAIAYHPNLAVVLTVDAQAPWQYVVSFVELAQKLEVEAFSFTIKQESQS